MKNKCVALLSVKARRVLYDVFRKLVTRLFQGEGGNSPRQESRADKGGIRKSRVRRQTSGQPRQQQK